MTHRQSLVDRRQFLKLSAVAMAAPTIVPASALGRDGETAPSNRINLGVVGLGSRGFNLLHEFLAHSDARVTALCDVHKLHYRDLPWGKGPAMGRDAAQDAVAKCFAAGKTASDPKQLFITDDFREVCDRDDIDAVVVATPDHWHAVCTLTALAAGKDVYCEKPLTHAFAEGQAVYQEVARRNAVFQTGSQQRSDSPFRHVVELVTNGHLGKVHRVEVGLPSGYAEPMGDPTMTEPPEHLDYDLWCGPAPVLPYMRARHHRWWRGHRAYGGGVLMDWIGHHNDIAHWALGVDRLGPQRVEAVGWKFPATDVYNTPQNYEIRCTYPDGVETSIANSNDLGTRLIGEDGWVYVRRGRTEASDKRWLKAGFDPGPKKVAASPGHTRNFLDCMKSREECIAPAEVAHRSITPGHLGYVSQTVGRALTWDAKNEQITDDSEADSLLRELSYRDPWSLGPA